VDEVAVSDGCDRRDGPAGGEASLATWPQRSTLGRDDARCPSSPRDLARDRLRRFRLAPGSLGATGGCVGGLGRPARAG
jgi:hypothetical protein